MCVCVCVCVCVRMSRKLRYHLLECCSFFFILHQLLHTMKENARLIKNASEQSESYVSYLPPHPHPAHLPLTSHMHATRWSRAILYWRILPGLTNIKNNSMAYLLGSLESATHCYYLLTPTILKNIGFATDWIQVLSLIHAL